MKYVHLLGLLVILAGCSSAVSTQEINSTGFVSLADREVQTLPDGTQYIVHPDEIRAGGPPKDGIPSIDNPQFVSVLEADEWIADNELVLAFEYQGEKRVYPLQILVWHEIVNDQIGGERVLVTYCPLCGSGIAYLPVVDGQEVEFGTSGKLWQSNLVMYDRLSDTYWSQIDGVAIIGEHAGDELEAINIDTVSWREYKVNTDAQVLSQDTGYDRNYGRDPYGSYYEDSFLMFPVDNEDNRIHNKDVVFGVEVNGQYVAYREEDVLDADIVDEQRGVVVTRSEDGIITITHNDEELVKERDFWFAWYAFHPETEVYGLE
jgi:hypothetical protein